MDILQKLKTQKKEKGGVLSSIFEKKELEATKPETPTTDPDIQHIDKATPEEKVVFRAERVIVRPQTFQSEGLREFDLDSFKGDEKFALKSEYVQKVSQMIMDGKIDEAITALAELKEKLSQK